VFRREGFIITSVVGTTLFYRSPFSVARGAFSTRALDQSEDERKNRMAVHSSFGVDKARAAHSAPRRASPSRTR
jgi:hypothetical protein